MAHFAKVVEGKVTKVIVAEQEFIDNCLNGIIIGLLLLGGLASLVFVLYLYNERNGNY